jgi:hypothetical protein
MPVLRNSRHEKFALIVAKGKTRSEVSFDTGGEIAKQFADAWFEKTDASLRKGLPNTESN